MSTKKTVIVIAALFVAISFCVHAAANDEPNSKPNIVVILADDLGYGDVSRYRATKIRTPNIDGLASDGMRFTDAHSAASLCSPSRYGLLTGRFPWRLRKKGNGYRLSPDRTTLASFLQGQGYTSAAIGKWHLGYSKDWNRLPITGPLKGTQGVKLNLADDSGDIRKKFKTAKEDAKKMGHVTNGPWRDGKGYAYEGGHRIPFIARWPGRIAAGSSSDCTLSLTDLFATATRWLRGVIR